jgi:hypothetical protein
VKSIVAQANKPIRGEGFLTPQQTAMSGLERMLMTSCVSISLKRQTVTNVLKQWSQKDTNPAATIPGKLVAH